MDRELQSAIEDILRIVPPSPEDVDEARVALRGLDPKELARLRSDLLGVEARSAELVKEGFSFDRIKSSKELLAIRSKGEKALERLRRIPVSNKESGSNSNFSHQATFSDTQLKREAQHIFLSWCKEAQLTDTPLFQQLALEGIGDRDMTRAAEAAACMVLSRLANSSELLLQDLAGGSNFRLFSQVINDANLSPFFHIGLRKFTSTMYAMCVASASGLSADSRSTTARRDWNAFRDLVVHAPELLPDYVGKSQAVKALARLHKTLHAYQPDVIIALSGGGEILGQFLKEQLSLGKDGYVVAQHAAHHVTIDRKLGRHFSRIAIVDDISRSGDTLRATFAAVSEKFAGADVKFATLVSSAVAVARTAPDFLVLPIVAASPAVTLPWNTKGTYARIDEDHIFGVQEKSDESMRLPHNFYEQVFDEECP